MMDTFHNLIISFCVLSFAAEKRREGERKFPLLKLSLQSDNLFTRVTQRCLYYLHYTIKHILLVYIIYLNVAAAACINVSREIGQHSSFLGVVIVAILQR